MELGKRERELLTLGIQAAIGIFAVWLALRKNIGEGAKQMQRVLKREAREIERMSRMKYRLERKALREKYRKK